MIEFSAPCSMPSPTTSMPLIRATTIPATSSSVPCCIRVTSVMVEPASTARASASGQGRAAR